MFERDVIVAIAALLIGGFLCICAVFKHPICFSSGIVSGIQRRRGTSAALKFVFVVGTVFCSLGILIIVATTFFQPLQPQGTSENQRDLSTLAEESAK